MEKCLTSDIREKIKIYIKNKIDISDLIKDYSIKGMDLSQSIISDFSRLDTDISGCNFAFAQIGSEDKVTSIIRTNMSNCNFNSAKFIGKVWMRQCNAQNCNFKNADVHSVDYQYTDFRGSTFCNSVITIGTSVGVGCRFPKEMFKELCKGWLMKIEVEDV